MDYSLILSGYNMLAQIGASAGFLSTLAETGKMVLFCSSWVGSLAFFVWRRDRKKAIAHATSR